MEQLLLLAAENPVPDTYPGTYFGNIIEDLGQRWYMYLAMPVLAAIIGYVTKIVALWMMFKPLNFVGIPPFLGWQGIIPRKAATMASIATDTMTQELISPKDIFDKIDSKRVAQEMEKPILAMADELTREVAGRYYPGLWESLPEQGKKIIIRRIQAEAPKLVESIFDDISANIDQVLDLKHMIVTNLVRDKELLNRIFKEVGQKEFAFIRNSGLYFGFAIGCVQAIVWLLVWQFTYGWLVLPAFGLFVGWFTDWLALKMVFRPQYPTRYVFFTWHGLFIKRRAEIGEQYGELIAAEIITSKTLIEGVLNGPLSDKLFQMIQKQVQKTVDSTASVAKPLVVLTVGSKNYQEMKTTISEKIIEQIPDQLSHMEQYAEDAMDLKNVIGSKMRTLTPEQFEGLLRPAFQQDEWILITVGALLGFIVGEMQVALIMPLAGYPVHFGLPLPAPLAPELVCSGIERC